MVEDLINGAVNTVVNKAKDLVLNGDSSNEFGACNKIGEGYAVADYKTLYSAAQNNDFAAFKKEYGWGIQLSVDCWPHATGTTPLMLAAKNGNPDLVKFILDCSNAATTKARIDVEKKSAMDYAIEYEKAAGDDGAKKANASKVKNLLKNAGILIAEELMKTGRKPWDPATVYGGN